VQKSSGKMATALVQTPIVPDCGDPSLRAAAEAAGVTLVKAAMQRGPIRDWRLTLGR
jgi:hypothetical protein